MQQDLQWGTVSGSSAPTRPARAIKHQAHGFLLHVVTDKRQRVEHQRCSSKGTAESLSDQHSQCGLTMV